MINIISYLNQPLPQWVGQAPVELYNFFRGKAQALQPAEQGPGGPCPEEANANLVANLTTPQDAVREQEVQKVVGEAPKAPTPSSDKKPAKIDEKSARKEFRRLKKIERKGHSSRHHHSHSKKLGK